MNDINIAGRCIGCLLLVLSSGWVQAVSRTATDSYPIDSSSGSWSGIQQGFYGPSGGGFYYQKRVTYRPNGQRSLMVDWAGNPPPATYAQQYPRYSQASSQPYLEVELSESAPFVQQTIIYTFRIISSGNLQVVNPQLPVHDSIILKKIDGPIPRARRHAGRQEIVNEFHFALTPMRMGEITLPPVRVTGRHVADRKTYSFSRGREAEGVAFDTAASGPLVIQVKPANPTVRPWLALHDLRIEGMLDQEGEIQAGRPLSLGIKLIAQGGDADRLPSVESQLQIPGFRVYRESTQSHNVLSADGRNLIGYRQEIYTLVPVRVAALKLPSIRLEWWNIDRNKKEVTVFSHGAPLVTPAAQSGLGAAGVFSAKPKAFGPSFYPEEKSFLPPFWIVMAVIAGASALVWFWIWSRDRPMGDKLRQWVMPFLQSMSLKWGDRLKRLAAALSLRQHWQNMRHRFITAMPMPFKLWFCARCLDKESKPTDWCQMFKFLACKHLKISEQVTISKIADEIIASHPGVEPASMRQLMHDLIGAVYGGKSLDFETWKRDFRRQLRPIWLGRRRQPTKDSDGLPQLNPHTR